ncbi:putative SEC22-synaptobrevin [Ceraceosorus guamensis]|uniref:Protein transport protein SEC22 n=1 Tax=Ceraceosorus guamensis TaxID=1522189 RepID=A0A316VU31_9BASI|nr:putative SEC22-synaptobrevin [Ceraceosorus guamensis]PWN41107.1 putative SEC22-synaptobrevin [Ceraceosorus guamensis]
MVLSTQIARVSDGLPLAQSVDDSAVDSALSEYKQQAKLLFRRISPQAEPRCTIESGPKYTLHYQISPVPAGRPDAVVFLVITDRSYPRKLAFSYLDELAKEFERSYGAQVGQRNLRPFAFVGFDTFMQRTKRLYADTRTAQSAVEEKSGSNLTRLNEDLQDVASVMTKNMEDLLWRGETLDQMSTMSSSLRDESLKYRKAAKQIRIDALIRQYAPIGAVAFLILFVLWIKFF